MLWMRDPSVAATSTCQNTTHTQKRDNHTPWRDSNPQSQKRAAAELCLNPRCHWDRRLYKTSLSHGLIGLLLILQKPVSVFAYHLLIKMATLCRKTSHRVFSLMKKTKHNKFRTFRYWYLGNRSFIIRTNRNYERANLSL
jgi:hypothetical protein